MRDTPLQFGHLSRRNLLSMIGKTAGGGLMYQAMASMGYAAESGYRGPLALGKVKREASVIVLGAGLAGMTAAYELRAAGYRVQILEYNQRAGGRCWTLRGGDQFNELGGNTQSCRFADGQYFNPGPWRIPYHHHAVLDYCKRFGVKLEPFVQVNHNALLHSTRAFGGKPQRFRHVQSDTQGHVSELLSKVTRQGALDEAVSKEDRERLLEGLKSWGALDAEYRYREGVASSDARGYEIDPGGGLMPAARTSRPIGLDALLNADFWDELKAGQLYEFQTTLFEPVGGMDMIARGFEREVGSLIRHDARVTRIAQSDKGVVVTYTDSKNPDASQQATADWCICTIPLSILSQIDIEVGAPMQQAIAAVPYGASFKAGLQFKRRFWEEDDAIFGGVSYTDLPIQLISYPSNGFNTAGPGVLLGAYAFEDTNAYEFTSMTPQERLRLTVEFGSQLHPQYKEEFDNGVTVGWHRVPWANGCFGVWSDDKRKAHYDDLCQVDGRIALAGEHASYIPAWMEGAILSGLDATRRLHERVQAT